MKKQAIGTMIRAKQAGFTLIELTAALAMAAVVYASFQWGVGLILQFLKGKRQRGRVGPAPFSVFGKEGTVIWSAP